MNAERLHAIALELHREMDSSKIVRRVEELRAAYEQVAATNSGAGNQEQFVAKKEAVRMALLNAPSDSFNPSWRQQLAEMGGAQLFGRALQGRIDDIFNRNNLTPAVGLKEMTELRAAVESFQKALDGLLAAFKLFHVGNEKLDAGECEIGMLIPRDAVHNKLEDFAEELNELCFILNTFAEVATGKPDDLLIKTISSSDLTTYLKAAIPFASCLAKGVGQVVALYKQLLEVKRLRSEMLTQGVPEEATAKVEDHANKLMSEGIEKISVEIVNEYYTHSKDHGRKNELTTQVRISLNRIANRIDRGYNIEVRVEPPPPTNEAEEVARATNANVQAIRAASKNMQFIRQEGQPLLKLPETTDKPSGKRKQ